MIRIYIICEGQTEETFVKDILVPTFATNNIFLHPSLVGKPGHKGGNIKFDRLYIDIRNQLLSDPTAYCTTFIDFYGLPPDFPGKTAASPKTSSHEKSAVVCSAMKAALQSKIGESVSLRFIPYVQMHEFESLLFSDPTKFAEGIYHTPLAPEFHAIRDGFSSPEDINDSPMTAPSKRILGLVPQYDKVAYGALAAAVVGLDAMRAACQIFDGWLKQLEALDPL